MCTASCRWNGGKHVFHVDLDVDVRATFGSAAFLVDDGSQRVVSLDARGRPVAPLTEGASYTVYTGSSKELRKQLNTLSGQLQAARHELARVHERVRKFEACSTLGLEQLRSMLKQQQANPGSVELDSMLATATLATTVDDSAAVAGAAAAGAPDGGGYGHGAAAGAARQPGEWSALPIGHLRTCYVEKNGTPRQGCISSAPAELRVELKAHAARNGGHPLNAAHALEGLEHFSHVWLVWVFDKNGSEMTKSKVKPPRLDGGKTGLFATRTPHRPNNVGLSLVRLEGVRGDTLRLSGVDIVDGTPILDVKPFLPFADTARDEPVSVAPWLRQMPTPDLRVVVSDEAAAQLRALLPAMRLLRDEAQARRAIEEVLVADPRSVHWRQQRASEEYGFCIDTLNVVCRFDDGVATVISVHHLHLSARSHMADGEGGAAAAPVKVQG